MLKQQTVLLLKVMLYEFIFEQSYTEASPLLQAQEIWACVTRPFLVGWLWAKMYYVQYYEAMKAGTNKPHT